LVIDDDPDIREILTAFLEGEGFGVATAKDGVEALDMIRSETPDLIILDMLMPNMDGFTVFRKLHEPDWEAWSKIPIVVLTSVREEAMQRRYELETGQHMDVADYIEKPLDPEAILASINRTLGAST
jgi:CheY-like chemotaxis protein